MSDLLSTNYYIVAATVLLPLTLPLPSVLQLPLKCCICYATSTATTNIASVVQLSFWEKQLKTPKTRLVSSGYISVLKSWLLLVPYCLWSHYAAEALLCASSHCYLFAMRCLVSGSPSHCICRINTPWHQLKTPPSCYYWSWAPVARWWSKRWAPQGSKRWALVARWWSKRWTPYVASTTTTNTASILQLSHWEKQLKNIQN